MSLRSSKPSYSVGDFCRVNNFECRVIDQKGNELVLKKIGYEDQVTAAATKLLPSLGKSARLNQERNAMALNQWKVGDFAKAMRQGILTKAKVFEISKDDTGRPYAIVDFLDNHSEDSVWLEELRPEKSDWKVGDFCRAMWSEDNVIYESQIKLKDSSEGRDYATVLFLGYGNEDTCWLDELMYSCGEEARKKQISEATGEPIAGEPQAVVDTTNETGKSSSPKSNNSGKTAKAWKDGDRCRAIFEREKKEYEATIKTINKDGTVLVHFIGLGRDETKSLGDLKASAGKEERARQRTEFNAAEKAKAAAVAASWVIGQFCRAVFTEDKKEYEAIIKSIEVGEDGVKYANIQYLGYGNEENMWLTNLLPSCGEEARQKQLMESDADFGNNNWRAGMMCLFVHNGTEHQGVVIGIDLATDANAESFAKVQLAGKESTFNLPLNSLKRQQENAHGQQLGKEWKVGDECRAIFEVDNNEYEGNVESIDSDENSNKYAIVRFIGYGDSQSVWLTELKASLGADARKQQMKEAGAEQEQPVEAPKPDIVEQPKQETVVPPVDPKPEQEKTPALDRQTSSSSNESVETDWKLFDFCKFTCKEDQKEHEGQIVELHKTKKHLVKVLMLGTDIKTVQKVNELKPSGGVEARRAETDANSRASGNVNEQVVSTPRAAPVNINIIKPEEPLKRENAIKEASPNNSIQDSCTTSEATTVIDALKNGTEKDEERYFSAVLELLKMAKKLSEEINHVGTIEDLRRQLDEYRKENTALKQQLAAKESVVAEVRNQNSFCHAETIKSLQELKKFMEELAHIDSLKAEKKSLLDEIVTKRAFANRG